MEDFFLIFGFHDLIVYVVGFWVGIVKDPEDDSFMYYRNVGIHHKAACCRNAEYHSLSSRNSLMVTKFVLGSGGNDRGVRSRFPAAATSFFLSSKASIPALRSTEPPLQWIPGFLPCR